uniref:Internal head protein n=1 Tax=Pseudomonas phage RVTF4 TaxID=3236931 RepID=A0AB39CCY9_9VIRU
MLVSLEEYRQLAANGVSKQTATVIAQDVLRITRFMGFNDAPALEAHADLSNAMSHALGMEDSDSIAGRIKVAIAKFKEWLLKTYNMIKDQIGAMLVSFNKMRERIEVLRGTAKSIPDSSKTEVHIPANMAQQVAIQGDFSDANLASLQKVAQFGSTTYPEAINEFFLELATVVKSYSPTESADTMVDAINQSLAPLNFSNIDNDVYPGNVMITPDEDGYNYSIAQVEARQVEGDITRPVRGGAEIQTVLNELTKVIDIAEKIEGTSTTIETSVGKVIEAADSLSAKVKTADEEQQNNASSLVSLVLSSTNKVNNSSANIIRYLGRVINAHLAIIEHEVKVATTAQRA